MTLATRRISGNNSGLYFRPPKVVVVHSTRSGRADFSDAQELAATLAWFTNPNGASAQWVLSETERVRVVEDALIAWHSAYLNGRSWGIEMTQPTIDRPYRDGHYDNAALVGRHYVSLGVAPVWLPFWNGDDASGFVAHQDTVQGRESGKTDPGPFDRVRFIASLEDNMDKAEVQRIVKEMLFVAQLPGSAATNEYTLEHWLGSYHAHRSDAAKHSAGEAHDHEIPAGRTGEA